MIALYFVVKWAVKNGTTEAYDEEIRKKLKSDLAEILKKEATEQEKNETM